MLTAAELLNKGMLILFILGLVVAVYAIFRGKETEEEKERYKAGYRD